VPKQIETELTRLVRATLSEQAPLGAYRIAEMLAEQTGRAAYANTVYRIIAPMVQDGEVIAIASAKGWILADRRWEHRLILLCEQCGLAEQLPAPGVAGALHAICVGLNFRPRQSCLEVLGLCRNCCGQAEGFGLGR
jgi:Fe2+ or Zn2+ uptake regulation protein